MRRAFLRWRRDEGGAVIVFAGVGIAAAVGIAAFVVDLSNAYSTKGRLQNAADAAALAAAQNLMVSTEEEARALALEFAQRNVGSTDGTVARSTDVLFGKYDVSRKTFEAGAKPYNAVKVTTHRTERAGNPVQTYFGGVFGASAVDVSAEAIALLNPARYCVFALDPSASGAFTATGGGSVRVPNCGIQVDSTASDAMKAVGNSSIVATAHCIGGGYSGDNISPTPQTECELLPDPLAHIPQPTPPEECYMTDESINYDVTLPAGKKYCGKLHISGSAHVTLQRGIHYFENAELHVAKDASFEGDRVMLYFDGDSEFHLTSTGTLVLTPPRRGTYRGIAFFGSRTGGPTIGKITGNRKVYVGGTIYVPRMNLEMAGDSGLYTEMETGFVITNQYRFSGTAEAIFDIREGTLPSGMGGTTALVR